MVTCPKCNKELSEGAKFCDGCGAQVFETIYCPYCGQQTSSEFTICQSCGASLVETPAEVQPVEAPKAKKKWLKKAIIFGGIGVVLIAAIIVAVVLLLGGSKKAKVNYALYLKDREIFFTNFKEDGEAWQLTSGLVDAEGIEEKHLVSASFSLGFCTSMSDDGKLIFFPDKINDEDSGFKLYYKEVGNPEAEAIRIDSDVRTYAVNSSATVVTYLKGDEGNLYQYKLEDDSKEKIASEVEGFQVSADGNKVGYLNSEGSIYLKYADKDKEKIASEISSLEHLNEDFTTVYYIKDDSLYKQVEGQDREKIASDVYDVIKVYDSGEIYYLKSEAEEISLMDYVVDDMKDADAAITKPSYPTYPDAPDYPSWWDYDTYEEYNIAYAAYEKAYKDWEKECDRIFAEYEAAYNAYWEKEYRDELRTKLAKETLDHSSYSLCFYDGAEDVVITDTFVGGYYSDYVYASDAPVISYETYNQSNVEKVKLSKVESIYDVENMVEDALFSSTERYVTVKSSDTLIEQEKEAKNVIVNDSGTIVYYVDEVPDDKNHGELYRISIADGVVGKPEVYDSDVYQSYGQFVDNDRFEYFKDYKDGKGEFYINKERIDYDVKPYSISVYTDQDKVFYFTDWNSEKEYGTLKVYQDGKSTKVADDVYTYSMTPDGRILYLYDYSLNYYKGELHEWNKGETRKIDDDVVALIPIIDSKLRGYTYGW